jgi:hypothetical protein
MPTEYKRKKQTKVGKFLKSIKEKVSGRKREVFEADDGSKVVSVSGKNIDKTISKGDGKRTKRKKKIRKILGRTRVTTKSTTPTGKTLKTVDITKKGEIRPHKIKSRLSKGGEIYGGTKTKFDDKGAVKKEKGKLWIYPEKDKEGGYKGFSKFKRKKLKLSKEDVWKEKGEKQPKLLKSLKRIKK